MDSLVDNKASNRQERALARDEADKLRHTLLDGFLRVLRYLCVRGQLLFHDAADVGDWKKSILFSNVAPTFITRIVRVPRTHGSLLTKISAVLSGHCAETLRDTTLPR